LAAEVIRQLIDAGIHFGHRVSRWNPKMEPYILTKRNSIHIIDPKQTLKGLLAARKFVNQVVARGKDLLLVGTKRQARKAIEEGARSAGMHYVTDRWLGGTLTNFRTIRARLGRLEKLEELEAGGLLAQQSKKEEARLRREMRKIRRNLQGIRNMENLPGVVFVVDAHREVIALREARKLEIPTVALIDSDSDPDMVDIPIPGNDDAMRAIELIVHEIAQAAALGKTQRTDKKQAEAAPPRRRSRRAVTARADTGGSPEPAPAPAGDDDAPATETPPPAPAAPATEAPTEPAS
jgi:small subunit ribosomal protein S2